jgi:integrase
MRKFFASVKDHHHGPIFRVLGMAGLRRGEACGLRWSDVDLDAGTLTVRHTITVVNGEARPGGSGKTRNARRVIDIDAGTVSVLKVHRKSQLEQRLLVGPGYRDDGYVFAQPDGRFWHPNVITRAFDAATKRTDLPLIRLHDLRHSHACHLLMAGVNIKVVSERLGHGSVSFTLDVYGHVMPGQQRSAAVAVGSLVDGGTSGQHQ